MLPPFLQQLMTKAVLKKLRRRENVETPDGKVYSRFLTSLFSPENGDGDDDARCVSFTYMCVCACAFIGVSAWVFMCVGMCVWVCWCGCVCVGEYLCEMVCAFVWEH